MTVKRKTSRSLIPTLLVSRKLDKYVLIVVEPSVSEAYENKDIRVISDCLNTVLS